MPNPFCGAKFRCKDIAEVVKKGVGNFVDHPRNGVVCMAFRA